MSETPSAENGLPAITRYFIPESSHARLRINCPNCTSEWGWCIDSPTNRAILEGLIATHVRQGCVIPPAARGANPYPNGHTHPSFVGCWEAKPLCPKYVTPPAEPEETR